MTLSPASLSSPLPRDSQLLPGAIGGNLARVLFDAPSASAGHFLLPEQFEKFAAQFTNAGGGRSLPSTSAGAMREAAVFSGKSRPHVIQIDHVAHFRLSRCERKFNRSAFA